MTKIALDVDGVLNRMDRDSPIELPWRMHSIQSRIGALSIVMRDDWGPMLLEVAAEAQAELFWHTFWENEANTDISPRVGLPELPVAPMVLKHFSDRGSISAIKGWSAVAYMAEHHPDEPFIVVDDDIGLKAYLDMNMEDNPVPYAFILVDDMTGLSRANVEDIIRYGKEFSTWTPTHSAATDASTFPG